MNFETDSKTVGEAARAHGAGERRRAEQLLGGVRGYAAARAEAAWTIRQGSPATERQQEAMQAARSALARVSPKAAADLRVALSRNPGLAERAATPAGVGDAMRAMEQEAEVRRSPELRAHPLRGGLARGERWRSRTSWRARSDRNGTGVEIGRRPRRAVRL